MTSPRAQEIGSAESGPQGALSSWAFEPLSTGSSRTQSIDAQRTLGDMPALEPRLEAAYAHPPLGLREFTCQSPIPGSFTEEQLNQAGSQGGYRKIFLASI